MNKKGFTLIELLAVIIILGILMIIAIPSVTKYINDSRKNSYIDTAKELVSGARNLVNEGKLEMYDTDATYYIDIACLKTENGGKAVSPYGDFVKDKAYVVVTFDGKGYDYYWTSIDDSGQGVKKLIKYDKLDIDNIESDLKVDDIVIDRGIDGRSKIILIREANNCQKEGSIPAGSQVNGRTGEEFRDPVVYPEGKTRETVQSGDLVKVGTEEFYVVRHDGTKLVLLAKYNLKVGYTFDINGNNIGEFTSNDPGYGLQDSNVRGWVSGASVYYGTVRFSVSPYNNYWDGKVGSEYPGTYCDDCTYTPGTKCAYIYDNKSNLYQYLQFYKSYLEESIGQSLSIRLLTVEEAYDLGCGNGEWWCRHSSANAPEWLVSTSYWIGSAYDYEYAWGIYSNGAFDGDGYDDDESYGVRPVIVI